MLLKLIWRRFNANVVFQKGKHFLEDDKSFFCAACGNASCSQECHQENYNKKNLCSFYENFHQDSGVQSLPSIVSKNIQIAQKNKLPVGKILNKTSNFFLMGYKHPKNNWIYFQRGYRQYGNPIQDTFDFFNVFEKRNIDYFKLKKRLCVCNCLVCDNKYEHSVLNCSQICDSDVQLRKASLTELFDYNQFDDVCQCKCNICSSGLINTTHTLKDCFDCCPHNILIDQMEQN